MEYTRILFRSHKLAVQVELKLMGSLDYSAKPTNDSIYIMYENRTRDESKAFDKKRVIFVFPRNMQKV
jgi:hypothetical protein